MARRKEILAAGIVRDIQFEHHYDLDDYLHALDKRKITYKVLETYDRKDGTMIIRIVQQYNDNRLIQLYKEN